MPRICIRSFGLTIALEVDLPEPLWMERMSARLPPGYEALDESECAGAKADRNYQLASTRDPRFEPRDYVLRADGRPILMTRDSEEVLDFFEANIDRFLAKRSETHVILQGGAVAVGEGAIVLPGRRSGVTTLVHALVRKGARYLSDASVVIDPAGKVIPYARELKSRRADGTRQRVPLAEFAPERVTEPMSIQAVVQSNYRPGGTWNPVEISRGRCVLAMLENSARARERTEDAFRLLGKACQSSVGWRGERGEAELAAADILARTGGA